LCCCGAYRWFVFPFFILISPANRGDVIGDAAKTAGKATNIAVKKVKEVDDRYRITERVTDVVKKGVSKVKAAVDSLDQ